MLHWQLQDAKAKFSEVMRLAKDGPQVITVHGKEEAVLISKERYDLLTSPKKSLVKMMQSSPLCGIDIDFKRDKSLSRDTDL
jgi:prevent-host-death family protein